MTLETFLHNLHFDIDKSSPLDFEVDWDDAPLPYKLYRGLPVIPLSGEVPLTLENRKRSVKPALADFGHFLWYVYGLTRFSQYVFVSDFMDQQMVPMHSYRRFVPSGGALYPNELYVYLKLEDLPAGIYHYDVARHRLALLRKGNFDSYLARALGNRCDLSTCFGTVILSTFFWKNFYKYNNFAYRLQGLDTGALLGQLLEVAKRFGFDSAVYFQFLDRAVNHLVGLSEREESVYAVIPLSVDPATTWFSNRHHGKQLVTATQLCGELAAVKHDHYVRSKRVLEYPMLVRMNEACLLESPRSFLQIRREKNFADHGEALELPRVKRFSYDLASVCRKRYSPGMDFVLDQVSQEQLAALLQEAAASFVYRNDLDGADEKPDARVSLYGCFYHVEGIPDGAFRYDSAAHALRPIRYGDHRLWLQHGMTLDNVNLFQVPLCLHVVGEREYLKTSLGYRGYRIQQMEAGILVQGLLLAASALGMGGHPLLGYDAKLCDEIYKIASQGKTSMIQIPVGPLRHRDQLEGGLHG